jgi:predicted dehydrogenase
MGGGVTLTCIHELDYLYWFFGKPIEISSFIGKFSDLGISADDLASILLKFKNNIIAEVHLDYFQRPDVRSCKIIGTKGTIYWNSETNTVKMYDIKKRKWIIRLKQKNYNDNLAYVEEIKYFLDLIKRRKKSTNDIKQGVDVLKIALAAKKASNIKRVIKLT